MSRYTLSTLVAREAPCRGKNKHNLNASCSPQSARRVREWSHGGRSTPATFFLSFSLLFSFHSRLIEITTLQYDNIAHKHVTISQFRDAITYYAARARKFARRMTPSELPCSIHRHNIDVNTLHLPSHLRLVEPVSTCDTNARHAAVFWWSSFTRQDYSSIQSGKHSVGEFRPILTWEEVRTLATLFTNHARHFEHTRRVTHS